MLESRSSPIDSHRPPPDILYSRAIPTFLRWRDALIKCGWKAVPDDHLPVGLLFIVEGPRSHSSSSGPYSTEDASGPSPFSSQDSIQHASTPDRFQQSTHTKQRARFALPAELSAFLEYREEIQESLRNPLLFRPVLLDDRDDLILAAGASDDETVGTLKDIFHLLQLIVPGMFLLVHDALSFAQPPLGVPTHGSHGRHRRSIQRKMPVQEQLFDTTSSPQILLHRTRRALPPAEWITSNMDVLDGVFGKHLLHELLSCARDVELTVWRTVHGPDGDPLDSGSDAGFEPSISPEDDWSDLEVTPGNIAVPSLSHAPRYTRRAYSL